MKRRNFMIGSGAAVLSPALFPLRGLAVSQPVPQTVQPYSNEMPDMLVSYLNRQLNDLADVRNRKRALLKTSEDVQERNAYVREKVVQMLRGFPERSPLDAVTVKTSQKNGYRIENVMFQSRPDFWVTGNLYVPTSGTPPFPAVISPCGHYPLARMLPQYQSAYISLAKSGFVVLGYDPIGQGERRQYWDPQTNVTSIGPSPTYEHSMPGQLLLLMAENLTEYMVWDGMRGIDYLLTRPEVDPKRIGCAGHSGGGTMTKFLSAVDGRIRCVAVIEGGTADDLPQNILPWQPLGPGDVEQNLFPAALYGIDNVDLLTAIAPRPLLTAIEHYGPAFDQAAHAIEARYRQLGVPQNFATVASDDPHAWTPKLRLATTDWFCRHFYKREGPSTESDFETVAPEDLYCTPDGSLRYSHKGQSIFSIIAKKQASLPPAVPMPKTSTERAAYQKKIQADIGKLLHYQKPDQPLDVRHVVTTPREGYRIDKVQFLSEPGIYIPAWVFIPNGKTGVLPTILYINDDGMEVDGMEDLGEEASGLTHGVLDTMARKGNLIVAVDVRGIGETRPLHPASTSCNEFGQLFDLETDLSYMSWSMDRSLLGMRVRDVVQSVNFAINTPQADGKNLHVIGKGMAGLWCLYAAALDSRIRSLISVESLLSYRSLASVDRYLYGADVFVPDVLLHFDLPQIAAAVASRPLTLIEPRDAMKNAVAESEAEQAYAFTRAAYEAAESGNLFRIESQSAGLDTPEHYLSLIQATAAT
ncbi:MAG: alpha/beta hydrolase [Acidobacteriaceae bacterium]